MENFRDWLNVAAASLPHGLTFRPGEIIQLASDGKEFVTLAAVPGEWTTPQELHAELHRTGADAIACVYLAMVFDVWMAANDRLMTDCADCRTDVVGIHEWYMVHDQVWQAAGMCNFGFLCIGCLEKRLGRRLAAADFRDLEVNRDRNHSDRLADRLTEAA